MKATPIIRIQTNVYKKRHRSGAITWVVRWKSPATGKWKVAAGGKTRSEALLLEARIRQELALGKDPSITVPLGVDLTVSDLIDRFYEHSRFLGAATGWRVENRSRLEKYVRPELARISFASLDANQILKFYIRIRDIGLTRPTIHKVHTLLCLLGDLFQEINPGAVNVPRRIAFGQTFPKRAPLREINFLTPPELERIYAATARSRQRLLLPLIQFLANTGLRRSEALNLRWTDIDRESGIIQVRTSKTGRARNVPLEVEAWEAIRHLEGHGEYVFSYPDGSRPDKASFRHPLQFAAKRAGIQKRVDLHTLRHSFASNKIRAGFGLKKVSVLLGHSDISMTANVYSHLLDGDLRVPDRDAGVFDKTTEQTNSERAKIRSELSANLLASLFVQALQRIPDGEQVRAAIERELDRIIAATAEGSEVEGAGLKQTETSTPGESEPGAPQMLRDRVTVEKVMREMEAGELDFSRLFAMLGHLKNGRGNVIRTRDLFVPNEAR